MVDVLPKIAGRVQETTLTTGTGSVVLSGATGNYRSFFSGIGLATPTRYTILSGDNVNWETNTGTLSGSGPYTMSRGTPVASSNGGSLIALGGTSTIFCDADTSFLEELATYVEVNGTVENVSTINFSSGLIGTVTGDVLTVALGPQPYDIIAFNPGTLSNGQVVYQAEMVRNVVLPQNLTGSLASCIAAATASATLVISNNGSSIGSLNFAASATSGTFIFPSAVTLVAGNVLAITNQATADATLGSITFTITGTR